MTNKELIEKCRAVAHPDSPILNEFIAAPLALQLCDRLEAAETEAETGNQLLSNTWGNAAALQRENDKLKGLLKYCYHLIPRGTTVDAGKWAERQKILGEG